MGSCMGYCMTDLWSAGSAEWWGASGSLLGIACLPASLLLRILTCSEPRAFRGAHCQPRFSEHSQL